MALTTPIHIWGIPNCRSVKKAIAWAESAGAAHVFHNFRKEPPTEAWLVACLKCIPLEKLVNRSGLTWRKLSEETRAAALASPDAMKALLLSHPTLIRRPVIGWSESDFTCGVSPEDWNARAERAQ